jgi:predicted aspartyl protease
MRRFVRLGLLAALSCAPAQTPGPVTTPTSTPTSTPTPSATSTSTSTSTPTPTPTSTEKRATLHYEADGQRFPLPMVHGSIGGTPTWMLVDTGATSHYVAGWIARKVGLSLKKLGDLGSDHAGRAIPTFRVEHPKMTIDEWGTVADGPVLATEVPPLYEQLGIGGFVSPQQLVDGDDGSVVLDFSAGEMRAAAYDAAVHRLGHHGSSLAPNGAHVCVDNATAIQGLEFIVPGAVEGKAVELLIDTGAAHSDLLAGSVAGKALAHRSVANKDELYTASGRVTRRTLRGATLSVGDFSIRSDVDVIPAAADPYCLRDGVVSMDLLRACVLVLGKTTMMGRCNAR